MSDDDQIDIAIMGARWPYYGFLLYLSEQIGGAPGCWRPCRAHRRGDESVLFVAVGRAPPRTHLELSGPYRGSGGRVAPASVRHLRHADGFAGLAGVGLVLLLAYGDRLSRAGKVAVFLLLAASFSFHTSHSLMILAVLVPAAALLLGAGRCRAVRC